MRIRSWGLGLTAGLIVGVGTLMAGTLAAIFGLLAILAATRLPRRDAAIGGLLVGLGGSWLALLLRADLACDIDCVGPDLTGWYALGAALIGLGTLLTGRAMRQASPG